MLAGVRRQGAKGGELPPQTLTPWAAGDEPHGQSLDLDEYPSALARLTRCRSFRADLRHKLEVIVRAAGGWRKLGVKTAAKRLGVSRFTLRRWYLWRNVPRSRSALETIDNAYAESLETLARQAVTKKRH
jgi:hypothetical protein